MSLLCVSKEPVKNTRQKAIFFTFTRSFRRPWARRQTQYAMLHATMYLRQPNFHSLRLGNA